MKRLFEAFEKAGKELYLVGGAVRDLALGAAVEDLDDLDFCTNARPRESLAILRANNFPTYDMGFEFGTVGAVLRGPEDQGYPKDVQVTTYRSEEYYRRGSRHPVVKFGDTILQDLSRRDFSINSIAMDASGQYVDPYHGLEDIERKILRVIGDPLETLAEDPLRILRIGRFVSKLGFSVDESLREAARARADCILDISRERWLQEMTKLVCGPHVATALRFLNGVRILGIILPEVSMLDGLHERLPQTPNAPREVHHKDVWAHTLQVLEQTPDAPALRWAALLHDIGKAWTRDIQADGSVTFYRHEQQGAMLFEGIARRFKFDKATADEVGFVIANHGRIPQYESAWSDAAVRRLVRDLDPYLDSLLAFARADLTTRFEDKRKAALSRIDELESRIRALEQAETLRPELPSGLGNVLIKGFGLKPSPLIGELKNFLEECIIEGDLESGRDADYYLDYLRHNPPDFLEEETGDRQAE